MATARIPSFDFSVDHICIEKVVQNVEEVKSIQDLFNIVIDIMEFYEKYQQLTGQEKLDKVKKMILLLMSTVKDEEKKRFYQDSVPMLIELVIEISKRKKLLINIVNKANCGCFKLSQ